MFAVAKISNVTPEGPDQIGADIEVSGSWGAGLTDHVSQNVAGVTPAQAINGIKNKVIAWAGSANGGNVTLTQGQVWIHGGVQ